jgi:RND family efflux transporter MFP subunit
MALHRIKVGLAVVLPLMLGGGGAFWLWGREHAGAVKADAKSGPIQPGPTSESTPSGPVVPVHAVKPAQGGVKRTVTRPATIHAFQYALLFTKVSGYLQNQTVDIGVVVKKGQLLAEIYAPEIAADLRKAEADLNKATAHVEVMKARVEESQADLQQAQNKLAQAQADVQSTRAMQTLRKEQYTRIKRLAEQRAVEEELVDEKLAAREAAEAQVRSSLKAVATAQSAVAAAKANVTRMKAELADALAQVKVAEAVRDRARAFEQYTHLRSPYDGLITQRGYHEGDFIRDATSAADAKAMFTVARTDPMRVITWVPDPAVPATRAGQLATVRVDALPGHSFTGKVARTADAEDPVSRTMRTEIDLPNPDGLLKEGMYGAVTIHLGKSKTGLRIPSDALGGDAKGDERFVYVVRDNRAHRVAVRVGLDDGIRAEVVSGLRPDDAVVVQHAPGLADGVAVRVVPAPPAK